MANDFLVEIFTEELPPKSLWRLGNAFLQNIKNQLEKAGLAFDSAQFFATPRRLAVLVKKLIAEQAEQIVDRKGPALAAAFDSAGKPTPACIGFARSCNVTPAELQTMKTKQGDFVSFQQKIPGKSVKELLPDIVQQALLALPIPKRMRWGANQAEFVRPVHAIAMLYGKEVIKATILGVATDRITYGHRFHSTKPISIPEPAQYEALLEKNHVIADFEKRRELIRQQIQTVAKKTHPLISEALLDEVTGIIEWPHAIMGNFSEEFLHVPREVLISAMQDHQRYFPIEDAKHNLLPQFVAISNIENQTMDPIIEGNERVLRARLSDAKFFYEKDKTETLANRVERLKGIVFHAKLGSLYDKTKRLEALSERIAQKLGADAKLAARAAFLSKADLTTDMVGEFPELQGVMGYYYALDEKESAATAIKDHYFPRFSGDLLPVTLEGAAVALSDRIDTLVGIFGINQAPTGDKDPFGLRRAALGIIRILIEGKMDLDLAEVLQYSASLYETPGTNLPQLLQFMQDRLKFWYQEQGITNDIFAAVAALNVTRPYDMHKRIQAVQAFKKLNEAESLSVANKRVSNILAQAGGNIAQKKIDANLFEHASEKNLFEQLEKYQHTKNTDYINTLTELSHLRKPVDDFFDHVMVMTDDQPRRENRLLLLSQLRALFLQVADIALLQ